MKEKITDEDAKNDDLEDDNIDYTKGFKTLVFLVINSFAVEIIIICAVLRLNNINYKFYHPLIILTVINLLMALFFFLLTIWEKDGEID